MLSTCQVFRKDLAHSDSSETGPAAKCIERGDSSSAAPRATLPLSLPFWFTAFLHVVLTAVKSCHCDMCVKVLCCWPHSFLYFGRFFWKFIFVYSVCVPTHMCISPLCTHGMWRPKGNFWELVLFFQYGTPGLCSQCHCFKLVSLRRDCFNDTCVRRPEGLDPQSWSSRWLRATWCS